MSGHAMGWLLVGLLLRWQPVQAQTAVVEYIHTDAQGSVVAVTDASRNVVERREYEPYGLQLAPAVQDGPGYTGHVQDAVTGLTYMQQRYYEPQLGVFLSVDPVTAYSGIPTHFNRYWYVAGNPYRFHDPDGRCTGSRITNSDGTCRDTGGFTTMAASAMNAGSSLSRMMAQAIPIPRPPPPVPMTGTTPDESGRTIGEDIVEGYRARQEQKTHVTYTLTKPGYPRSLTYIGRASGYGTPEQVMMQRYSSHGMRIFGYGNPTLDVSRIGEAGRLAIRGREQQMIDAAGGVRSDFVGNSIRAVSPINPLGRVYHEAANAEFGNIAPYTGW